jgi:hypothetical protein
LGFPQKVQNELLAQYATPLLEKEHSGCFALLHDDKVQCKHCLFPSILECIINCIYYIISLYCHRLMIFLGCSDSSQKSPVVWNLFLTCSKRYWFYGMLHYLELFHYPWIFVLVLIELLTLLYSMLRMRVPLWWSRQKIPLAIRRCSISLAVALFVLPFNFIYDCNFHVPA